MIRQFIYISSFPAGSGVTRVNFFFFLGGGGKIVAYPEILQPFDKIYPVGISVRKSLIKVAINEI